MPYIHEFYLIILHAQKITNCLLSKLFFKKFTKCFKGFNKFYNLLNDQYDYNENVYYEYAIVGLPIEFITIF